MPRKRAYQYGYINIKNLDNTSKISNFALMKNFAAIDFETANQQRTSICSVGIVIVRDSEIVDCYYSLIKPEPEYYSYWNTRVHGLTMEDTMNARVFPEVWAEIEPKIEGLPLVAHKIQLIQMRPVPSSWLMAGLVLAKHKRLLIA